MAQALEDVTVLDLTRYIAGPYCTKLLAGYGAKVIKIEKPCEGDPARRIGPFLEDRPHLERSAPFFYLNTNKRSITLDIKTKRGQKILRDLVKNADILVESFSPGVAERLGLEYERLAKINEKLIVTSVSNFGCSGPYRDYKANQIVLWAMSGWRYCDGKPGHRPIQPGGWLTHYIAGLHAAVGTMTALHYQRMTGIGQHVDVSMMEALMLSTIYPSVVYSYTGNVHQGMVTPLGILPCKDGYIGLDVLTQPQWEMLCRLAGMPELLEDPRFETTLTLRDHLDEAIAFFVPWLEERNADEIFHSGQEWRIPVGLIPTAEELLDLPTHKARGFLVESEHSEMGRVTMPGAPFKMSETPWQLTNCAPLLGEHSEEVYREHLGYSPEDLARLREGGII